MKRKSLSFFIIVIGLILLTACSQSLGGTYKASDGDTVTFSSGSKISFRAPKLAKQFDDSANNIVSKNADSEMNKGVEQEYVDKENQINITDLTYKIDNNSIITQSASHPKSKINFSFSKTSNSVTIDGKVFSK